MPRASGRTFDPRQYAKGCTTKADCIFVTATARTIELRDGAELLAKTYAPQYLTEPGPNGPQCEPRTCQVARFAVR